MEHDSLSHFKKMARAGPDGKLWIDCPVLCKTLMNYIEKVGRNIFLSSRSCLTSWKDLEKQRFLIDSH